MPALTLALAASVSAQGSVAPPVDAAYPLQREVTDYDIFTGRFEAVELVELRSRVTGYLDAVSFQDGDLVQEGQLLFSIDPRTFEAILQGAQANLAAAIAARNLAHVEFERAQELASRNVGTKQDVDRTSATLAEAEAQVLVARAQVRAAQLDVGFTEIRAPFAGRMSNRRVDSGNLVAGGTGNNTLLSTIVLVDPIQFVFSPSESDFLRYARRFQEDPSASPGRRDLGIAIKLMDEDEFTRRGSIDFVDNRLDPNSGTITARAVLPNPKGILRPGVFGRIRVPASEPYLALQIPDAAILSDQARKIVMVVDDEGNVSTRAVVLGDMYQGLRVVKAGLDPQDRVVVNGIQKARPGGQVAVEMVDLSSAPG